jgi:hypothetical protein
LAGFVKQNLPASTELETKHKASSLHFSLPDIKSALAEFFISNVSVVCHFVGCIQ